MFYRPIGASPQEVRGQSRGSNQPCTCTEVQGLPRRDLILRGQPPQLGQGEDRALPAHVAAADVAAAAHADTALHLHLQGEPDPPLSSLEEGCPADWPAALVEVWGCSAAGGG